MSNQCSERDDRIDRVVTRDDSAARKCISYWSSEREASPFRLEQISSEYPADVECTIETTESRTIVEPVHNQFRFLWQMYGM